MSTIKDETTARLAARLRELRRARGWSLDDFAARSGVSKAMLSRIERAASSPTAALLGRISGALGLTLSALLTEPQARGGRLLRASEQSVWRDPATGYVRRLLSPPSDLPLQLVEVHLPPGARVPFPASAYTFFRQLIWMVSGTLHFTEGEVEHVLRGGDCLELGDPTDCVFHNQQARPARYIVALVTATHVAAASRPPLVPPSSHARRRSPRR